MRGFNPELHNRNIGYYIVRTLNPGFTFFESAFLAAKFPFHALWDGRRDLAEWKAGKYLAGFVLALFLLLLFCIDKALDGDSQPLLLLLSIYSGLCFIFATTVVLLDWLCEQFD